MTTPGAAQQDLLLLEPLFFDGCPNSEALLPHLRRLLEQAGVNGDVRLVEVLDDAAAQRLHFLGSPTVRVDGRDVEPAAADRHDYALQCRLYDHDGHRTGTPADQWILAALANRKQPAQDRVGDAASPPAPAWGSLTSRAAAGGVRRRGGPPA